MSNLDERGVVDGNGERLPFVSIIVPVFNAGSALASLCRCLCDQDYPRHRYEAVIVDDGSTDGVLERVAMSYPDLVVVRQCRSGSYSARNTGAVVAAGAYLAFTDADCLPAAQWLRAGITSMREQHAGLAAGAVKMVCDDATSAVQRYDCTFNLSQQFYATQLGFGATANLFVERSLFDLVGGFDADLRSGGDQRFCLAARSKGGKLVYIPDAEVRHPARRTMSALVKKTVRVAMGRARAFPNRYYYFPRVLKLMPATFYDPRAASMPLGLRMKFTTLHYLLEAMRIGAYACGRWAALRREARTLQAQGE